MTAALTLHSDPFHSGVYHKFRSPGKLTSLTVNQPKSVAIVHTTCLCIQSARATVRTTWKQVHRPMLRGYQVTKLRPRLNPPLGQLWHVLLVPQIGSANWHITSNADQLMLSRSSRYSADEMGSVQLLRTEADIRYHASSLSQAVAQSKGSELCRHVRGTMQVAPARKFAFIRRP